MTRSPLFWIGVTLGGVYVYHHWVKPLPGAKSQTVLGLAVGVTFVGYVLIYYGLTQVKGFNYGLLDLVIPSRWATAQNTPKDGAS